MELEPYSFQGDYRLLGSSNKLHAVGWNNNVTTIYYYDETWTVLTTVPYPAYEIYGCILGDILYILVNNGKNVGRYNIQMDEWSIVGPSPQSGLSIIDRFTI